LRPFSRVATFAVLAAAAASTPSRAQSLRETVDAALSNYPSIRVSDEQVKAAAAGITLARTAWLPRVDGIAQVNRATKNNIYGLLLPQSVLPSISGPPNPVNDMGSVWGSAIGFLVSWEPFDFGQRQANLNVAEASRRRAETTVQRTRFEVAALAADAYLTAIAAQETVRAAEAQVARARQVGDIVRALAKAELRPGADVSRIEAELASAEIQVVNANNAVAAARATLLQLTGKDVQIAASNLTEQPPDTPAAALDLKQSPYAIEQQASIAEAEARRRVIERAYYPKFSLQGASYARGTGVMPNGATPGGANGLGPNIYNYAVGLTVTFPALDLPSIRARKEIAEHQRLAETARYEQVLADLNARVRKANDQLETARRVSALVPRQLEAARAAESQAGARYKAGLGTLVEVAEAQRLLTQSEIDAALARLNIWRSMLQIAAAAGDLKPFLDQVR
jgi:outer membrane protein TolC